MPALELLTGFVTAPDTTQTALTMAAQNSLTVRNAPEGTPIYLLNTWTKQQTAGILRIMSPFLHDNVQGIRIRPIAAIVEPLLPLATKQPLVPQDSLTVDLSGSATVGDIETACLLLWYQDIPGLEAQLFTADEIEGRIQNIMAVENTLSSGTAGGYSGSEALNVEFDQFRHNTDYAILGFLNSVLAACIRYRAADWGNLGLGGPAAASARIDTRSWFMDLSRATGLPTVPVFNSASLANVLIDCAQDEDGGDPIVNTILAELS